MYASLTFLLPSHSISLSTFILRNLGKTCFVSSLLLPLPHTHSSCLPSARRTWLITRVSIQCNVGRKWKWFVPSSFYICLLSSQEWTCIPVWLRVMDSFYTSLHYWYLTLIYIPTHRWRDMQSRWEHLLYERGSERRRRVVDGGGSEEWTETEEDIALVCERETAERIY